MKAPAPPLLQGATAAPLVRESLSPKGTPQLSIFPRAAVRLQNRARLSHTCKDHSVGSPATLRKNEVEPHMLVCKDQVQKA